MTTTCATRPIATAPASTQQCQPWCDYQDCWQDPAANPAEGVACISAEQVVQLEGPQPLATARAWPSLSLYLGPNTTQETPGLAVLLAHGDNQGIHLSPAKARELAAALTSLAALADATGEPICA